MCEKTARYAWALLLTLTMVISTSPALAAEKQPAGGKAAIVNGVAISQEELDLETRRVEARLLRSGRSPNPSELGQLKKSVLETLIARELLYQESQKKDIKIDQAATNQQFEEMKGRFPSEEEFNNALISMHLSEASLRSQLERDQVIRALVESELSENLAVSDEEVKAYYDSNQASFKQPAQVKASHILIKVEEQADESKKTEARQKIEMVQGKLKKGEDFSTLAKEYSEGPSNTKGGDLGYFSRGQMVKPFEEAAFALKPGEVSDIVQTRFGYHLIKVTDKKPETTVTYDEIKDRLGQYLKQQKLQKEMGLYVERLKSKAKVEVL